MVPYRRPREVVSATMFGYSANHAVGGQLTGALATAAAETMVRKMVKRIVGITLLSDDNL